MDQAVAGLIGVGVGGVLTTGGQLFTNWLSRRRDDRTEATRDAKRLRLAARLVMEELAEAASLIEGAARSGRYWPQPRALPTETWNQQRNVVAESIDAPLSWRMVTSAYDAINNLNWIVDHRRHHSQEVDVPVEGARVTEHDCTRDAWRAIRLAIATLEQTIGVQGPASRVMREAEDAEAEYWPHGDGEDFDADSARIADRRDATEAVRRATEGR